MILLVASSLALLVVYAGVKLLIQTKKETLGNIFRCAAWFFIVAGFLILACTGACCIAICCKYGAKMMRKEYKMKSGYGEDEFTDRYKYHKKMMKHHSGECGEDRVFNINCCCAGTDRCCDHGDMCKPDTLKYKK